MYPRRVYFQIVMAVLVLALFISGGVILHREWRSGYIVLGQLTIQNMNLAMYNLENTWERISRPLLSSRKEGLEKVQIYISERNMSALMKDLPLRIKEWQRGYMVYPDGSLERIKVRHRGDQPSNWAYGKNFAAGYVPLNAVITNQRMEKIIKEGQGRIQHGHTHQGHSLGAAAALAVQKVVQTDDMLGHILEAGQHMRDTLSDELSDHPFYRDVRERGLLFSFEYDCVDKHQFSLTLQNRMQEEHGILINAKWHRTAFAPPYIVDRAQVDLALDRYIDVFKDTASSWTGAGED